ncbi:TetR/AcrR family transcriptional regulator [Longispora urticae]
MTTMSLRERKKQQTKQSISDVATRMFIERGFDAVTISEIAAAAQVAKMTVTNYFPRKEDLALDLSDAFTGSLARTVADRPEGESAFGALRRDFLAAVDREDPVVGFAGLAFVRMITDSPALTARLRDLHDLREKALADALAAETGAADITPRAVAAQLGGTHRVLFDEIVRHTLAGLDNAAIARELRGAAERAFDLLEPALGGYAVR